ncbi:hypothetical protein BGZ82_004685, partial [Podila clonocystis]
HRTRPTTVHPSSNSDPSSADPATRSSETKEPSQHARKTAVDVFYASGSDTMDEDASMASNIADGPAVQAPVDPSPAVAEALAC